MNAQLMRLVGLQSNWDSYGAPPISSVAIDSASLLLDFFKGIGGSAPFVGPMPCGGVQLEWHEAGFDVEIECQTDGKTTLLIEKAL